jgi:putative intracellular protease/amidase
VQKQQVGILIFDGVELLDFAGSFEVFSRTRLTPGVGRGPADKLATGFKAAVDELGKGNKQ